MDSNTEPNNPTIAPSLRIAYVLVAVVVIAGASLFFFPDLMVPRWPWPLTPFNTRFLGGIYVVELTAIAMTLIANRWAPARLVLPLSFGFGTIVTLVSLFYISRFDFAQWTTYAWFFLYVVATVAFGYFLWYYRNTAPADTTPTPPAWRVYFLIQGLIFGLYSIGLLALPSTFSAFWPWAFDDFHARIYSCIFMLIPVGTFVLYRVAAPVELFTMGVTQVVLALCSVLGVVIVDASAHRVNWSSLVTWVWIAGFAVLFVSGAAMISYATARGLFRRAAGMATA